jgi:hypothetical protein
LCGDDRIVCIDAVSSNGAQYRCNKVARVFDAVDNNRFDSFVADLKGAAFHLASKTRTQRRLSPASVGDNQHPRR